MPRQATTESRSYEEEQEILRRELEGDQIQIEIPKDPEVDPIVYKDVEPMLFRGFLVVSATINDVPIVFKSLNQHEFSLLSMLGGASDAPTARFWNLFLAYAVFLFDGQNVLADREAWLGHLADTFETMPKGARDRVVRHLSELNRRASNATRLTEAYVTEIQSRYRWAQLRGMEATNSSVTGIAGTGHLGMNWAQLTWRALNYYEDLREQVERDWDNAKFIGSCFAGKGLSKVYNQDNERRRKEREERFSKKDALLRHVILGQTIESGTAQYGGVPLVHARTTEELSKQMAADLRGEQDWHDFVVQQHEQNARDAQVRKNRQLEELVEQRDKEYGSRQLVGSTDLTGLTRAEVDQRIAHQKAVQAQQAAQRIVLPDVKEETFIRKWGLDGTPISEVGVTDKDPTQAIPMQPQRDKATPFRGKRR